jgi:hypothetical protein
MTVGQARQHSGGQDRPPQKVIGRDGKSYSIRQRVSASSWEMVRLSAMPALKRDRVNKKIVFQHLHDDLGLCRSPQMVNDSSVDWTTHIRFIVMRNVFKDPKLASPFAVWELAGCVRGLYCSPGHSIAVNCDLFVARFELAIVALNKS